MEPSTQAKIADPHLIVSTPYYFDESVSRSFESDLHLAEQSSPVFDSKPYLADPSTRRFESNASSYKSDSHPLQSDPHPDQPHESLPSSLSIHSQDQYDPTNPVIPPPSSPSNQPFTNPPEWTCCKCAEPNPATIQGGTHPLGHLQCPCTHHPCPNCTFANPPSAITTFSPTHTTCSVPLSEHGGQINYGIICPHCGLSHRLTSTSRFTQPLNPGSSVDALPLPLRRLKNSLSSISLALTRTHRCPPPSSSPPPPPNTLREFAVVRFTGVQCGCGAIADGQALGFHIADAYTDRVRTLGREARVEVGWSTEGELLGRGHGGRVVWVGGKEHPNPLGSAPVGEKDM